MLILSRKTGESLVIDGRIIVKIIRTDGDTVKVGIEAPQTSLSTDRKSTTKSRNRTARLPLECPSHLTGIGKTQEHCGLYLF